MVRRYTVIKNTEYIIEVRMGGYSAGAIEDFERDLLTRIERVIQEGARQKRHDVRVLRKPLILRGMFRRRIHNQS